MSLILIYLKYILKPKVVFSIISLCLAYTSYGQRAYRGGYGDGYAMAESAPTTLSIVSPEGRGYLTVSPNPVAPGQPLQVQYSEGCRFSHISLQDASGRVIFQYTGAVQQLSMMAPLQPGVYILLIDRGRHYAKVVVK